MPLYLMRATQTPETWANLIRNPEDRRIASEDGAKGYGGKFHGYWYALGEDHIYSIIEAPDNVAAASLLASIAAGGGFSSISTTALLTVDEMIEALQGAREIPYSPPGAKSPTTDLDS